MLIIQRGAQHNEDSPGNILIDKIIGVLYMDAWRDSEILKLEMGGQFAQTSQREEIELIRIEIFTLKSPNLDTSTV